MSEVLPPEVVEAMAQRLAVVCPKGEQASINIAGPLMHGTVVTNLGVETIHRKIGAEFQLENEIPIHHIAEALVARYMQIIGLK